MTRLSIIAITVFCIASLPTTPAFAATTPVTDCGAVLSEPGNYMLANDLVICDRGRLDIGIEALDVANARITNGRVSDSDIGSELFQSRRSRISNMILHDNVLDPYFGGFGIVGFEASANEIVGNDASRNTTGIELFFSGSSRITRNTANDNARSENSPFFPSPSLAKSSMRAA